MIPELGKYATEILSSYAISIVILLLLVWGSLRRSRRVKIELEQVEARVRKNG